MRSITKVEPCVSVVYVSSAVTLFSKDELLELIRHSQEANSKRGLTGMLLHRDGSFIQALEGPESEVNAVMAKIKLDPRHSGLLVLLTREVEERQFADWSMGFRDLHTLSPAEAEVFKPYLSSALAVDLFRSEPTAALKLLKFFKTQMR